MNESDIRQAFPSGRFRPIVVTEVTRMSKGNYCVAAWDVHARSMVRPLQATGGNWRLGADRSVFSVGKILDCVPTGNRRNGFPHATEDLTLTGVPTILGELDEGQIHALVIPYAHQSVREVFGVELTEDKYITDGTRCNSLGALRISPQRVRFIDDGYGKLRLHVLDATNTSFRLAVTCDQLLHLFSPSDDEAEPHFGVTEANEWLDANPPRSEIVLRLGLARGWDGPNHQWAPLRCYAQVNGIVCPQDNFHIFAGPP